MLRDALKMKSPLHGSGSRGGSHDHGEPPYSSSHSNVESDPRWQKGLRVDLPIFDGEGVEEWVFRVREYFNVYNDPEEWRIRLLSFHLVGPAYSWYR